MRKFFRNPKFKEEDYAISKIQDEDRKQEQRVPVHSDGPEPRKKISEGNKR